MDKMISKNEVLKVLRELRTKYMYNSYDYQVIVEAINKIEDMGISKEIDDLSALEDDLR